MGTRPSKAAGNVYCQCRLEAAKYNDKLSSREGAAELLGLSPSTLASYELGLTKVVPVENVVLMADLYNTPELRNWYCTNICPLGGDIPVVRIETLDRIIIQVVSALRSTSQIKDTLLDITDDGMISEAEKPRLADVIEKLKDIMRISQELVIWAEKNM